MDQSADVLFPAAVEDLAVGQETMIDHTVALVYQELPSYAGVPLSRLRASVERNVDVALRALHSKVPPTPDCLPEAEVTARERVSHGVPIEDMMRAYRINIGVIEKQFVEIALRNRVSPHQVLEGSRLLWSVGDAFTTRLAQVYQERGIEGALHEAHRRSTFVRGLLAGSVTHAEMVSQCALYGLDDTQRYRAVRARSEGREGNEDLRRQLERNGSTPDRPALIAALAGDFAGIVARRPADVPDAVVGIGPEVPLTRAVDSFRTASRVLDAASHLGKVGVFGVADLSWRLAAATEPEVGTYLVGRYLTPLSEHGEFGQLLESTLRAYMANGQNVRRTAAELVVHENTLRHRLHKFSEITGVSLSSTEVIVELAWALEFQHVQVGEPDVRIVENHNGEA